jgi:hypothetical protein
MAFADILQDEWKRSRRDIQEEPKTAEELLKQLWILSLI